jgi:hypothetical protein
MSIFSVRRSVACYVTRTTADGEQLLVLEPSVEVYEHDVVEIPMGDMLPFEGIIDAANRVLAARTGLIDLVYVEQLGGVEIPVGDPGGAAMTTFVHLTAPSDGSDRWEQIFDEDGLGADAALDPAVTVCRWVDLPLEVELVTGQDAYLDDALA